MQTSAKRLKTHPLFVNVHIFLNTGTKCAYSFLNGARGLLIALDHAAFQVGQVFAQFLAHFGVGDDHAQDVGEGHEQEHHIGEVEHGIEADGRAHHDGEQENDLVEAYAGSWAGCYRYSKNQL